MNLLRTEENILDHHDIEDIIKEDMEDAVNHGILVSNLAYYLARELQMSDDFCKEMAKAGMLHDIGKLKLSKYLYGRRKNTLIIEEMKYIRMHSTFSYEILRERDYSDLILESVFHHHENYDGSGYPDNLKGFVIPWGARILRVCDVFAALISIRPYRTAFDVEATIELMIDEVKNFDLEIFLAFQRVVHSEDFHKIQEHIDEFNQSYTSKTDNDKSKLEKDSSMIAY